MLPSEPEDRYFVNVFAMDRTVCEHELGTLMPIYDRIIRCMYFMLTTLSTVGYGVYTPQSLPEKIFGCLIQIIGVTFFSIVMD